MRGRVAAPAAKTTVRAARPRLAALLPALLLPPLILLASAPAHAQAQDTPGFSLVVGLGYEDGGPGDALVDALTDVDMDGERPGTCAAALCEDPVQHPFHFDEGLGLAVLLGFRYRFPAPVSIETLLSNGQRGHAEGYDPVDRGHLVISHASFLLSGTLGLHLGHVRLGAGPALNATGWTAVHDSANREEATSFTLGWTAGAAWGFDLRDMALSVRASVHRFPAARVANPEQLPISAPYDSFTIGVTAAPWARTD